MKKKKLGFEMTKKILIDELFTKTPEERSFVIYANEVRAPKTDEQIKEEVWSAVQSKIEKNKKFVVDVTKTLKDYSPKEIRKFSEIHDALESLKANYNEDARLVLSKYSLNEIAECRGYYELLTAAKHK